MLFCQFESSFGQRVVAVSYPHLLHFILQSADDCVLDGIVMVDFSRLGNLDSGEIEAREAARREESYVVEEAIRDRDTKKALAITLVHEPEIRFRPSGEQVVLLRGVEDGRTSPLTAVFTVPSRTRDSEEREASFDQTLRGIGGGDRVSLAGQWSKRGWNNSAGVRQETWEFKTQIFQKGDFSLGKMLENARAERLGVPVDTKTQSRLREESYVFEEEIRDRDTKRALSITLAHEPEIRLRPSGERVVLLRGMQDGRTSPISAVFTVPSRTRDSDEREASLDRVLRGLGEGDKVSLAGEWSKLGDGNQAGVREQGWEFRAQIFQKGDVTLDKMLENARAERLAVPVDAQTQVRASSRAAALEDGIGR